MAQVASDDTPHPAITFIAALFGGTEQPIFFQTLANDPSDEDEARFKPHLLTRDVDPIVRFVVSTIAAAAGMFFCVATIADGQFDEGIEDNCRGNRLPARRSRFQGHYRGRACQFAARIAELRHQPTIIVRSGGGIHLYWCFKESLDTQEYLELIEGALSRLADILAGDTRCLRGVARLMQLPRHAQFQARGHARSGLRAAGRSCATSWMNLKSAADRTAAGADPEASRTQARPEGRTGRR